MREWSPVEIPKRNPLYNLFGFENSHPLFLQNEGASVSFYTRTRTNYIGSGPSGDSIVSHSPKVMPGGGGFERGSLGWHTLWEKVFSFVCLLLIEYGLSSVWFLTLPYVMCNVAQAKVVLGMGFLYSSPRFLMIKNFNFPPTPPLPQFQSNVCNRHYTAGLQSPLARALSWKLLPKSWKLLPKRRTQQKKEKKKKWKWKKEKEKGERDSLRWPLDWGANSSWPLNLKVGPSINQKRILFHMCIKYGQ